MSASGVTSPFRFCLHREGDNVAILLLLRWQSAYLPARWEVNGDGIHFLKRKLHVDWVDAASVIKQVLLGATEKPDRNQNTASGPRCPAGNLETKLRHEGRLGIAPVRFVRQFHVDGGRDVLLDLILEVFLSPCLVFVALFFAPLHGFQTGKRGRKPALQITRV